MGPPSTRFVRYGVCWVTADKQALPPNSTMEMGSQSHRRRAVAASGLLLLGALAMLAVMTTQDADQSAPVARMDVAADEIAQEDTLTEAPMAKVDHFDSMRAWATAKAQAKKVSHAAKRLKKTASKANNDLKKKQQLARKSKKKQAAKMGKLTHKKFRKSRPDRNGQARLNALNVRSQTLVVKLNENMREIKELQRHLHKAKKENKTMAKKAHKRKVVLKVAQSAYRHLSHAVKRLKKIVMLNKQRDRVISERPVGLGFTKKLLHTVGKSVKKAVKKAKSAGLKRLKAGGKKGAAKAY